MSLDKNLENLKFDTRLQEWAVKTGLLKEEDLKKQIHSLPDVSNNAIKIEFTDERSH